MSIYKINPDICDICRKSSRQMVAFAASVYHLATPHICLDCLKEAILMLENGRLYASGTPEDRQAAANEILKAVRE